MKKAELIIGVLALIGLVLNLLLIPGGNVLTVLTLSTLSIIYFYLGLPLFNGIRLRDAFKKVSYTGISRSRKVGAIVAGIALSMTTVGIMFKFQSWPGAYVMLSDGLVVLFIITVVGLIKYANKKSDYYTRIFKRTVVFGGLGSLLILIPQENWIDLKYRNQPAYRDALKNAATEPTNPTLGKKAEEERKKMNNESR